MKPLFDRVLIKKEIFEENNSMIIIPETAREEASTGVVVEVGEEVTMVKPTDKVIFGKYTGSEITFQGVDYIILRAKDLFCIV